MLLLDSHALLWILDDSPRLGPDSRQLIEDSPGTAYSAASLWELTIKHLSGRIDLGDRFVDTVRGSGLTELPVHSAHIAALGSVRLPHRDPFDRLLVAQARSEGMRFLTADAAILGTGLPFLVDARG